MSERKFKTAADLQHKIEEYFNYCDESAKPKTVLGMCNYMDISRETLCNMEGYGNDYLDAIKKAKGIIEQYAADMLFDRNSNTTGIIFNLKNNFGWKDKQEIESYNENVNHNNDLKGKSTKEIQALIDDLRNKTK